MASTREPVYSWDEETGTAMCILTDGKNSYVGTAHCSEKDQDMKSEKTGCYIAEGRAQISYFTHVRDNEIKPKLAAYKELYYSINQSKRYNPDSYENHMLQHKIDQLTSDLDVIKDMIATEKATLKEYMRQKGILYEKVRNLRASDKNN